MKRSIFCIMSLFCISIMANDLKRELVVWEKDGTKVTYMLYRKPKVTFGETELVITINGIEESYPLESISRFTYEDNATTDIEDLETASQTYKFNDEYLLFSNLKASSCIAIYSIEGMLIFQEYIHNNEYVFPLSQLTTGVYVVNVNNLTYQIIKR